MGKPSPKNPHGPGVRLYGIWSNMRTRCSPTARNGQRKPYVEKGITVCQEWHKYDPFYDWAMANGYRDDLSIDRIDNAGGYNPGNCRWATWKQQARNKDVTILVDLDGCAVCLSEFAEHHGVDYANLYTLYRGGMPLDLAVSRIRHHVDYKGEVETERAALARRVLAECVTPGSRTHQALVDNKLFGSTAAVSAKQALHAMERFAAAVEAQDRQNHGLCRNPATLVGLEHVGLAVAL